MSLNKLIERRLDDGVSPTRIANELGCSRSYVYDTKWRRSNPERYRAICSEAYRSAVARLPSPPTRKWTDEEFSLALEMKRAGKSATQIALALNRSRNSVIGRLWRSGV